MKAIIKGKIYDTCTATCVGNGDNGRPYGDGYLRTVEIYRTPRGKYFVYTAESNILPLSETLKTTENAGFGQQEATSILDWIEEWNITNLKPREIELFGITEA